MGPLFSFMSLHSKVELYYEYTSGHLNIRDYMLTADHIYSGEHGLKQ